MLNEDGSSPRYPSSTSWCWIWHRHWNRRLFRSSYAGYNLDAEQIRECKTSFSRPMLTFEQTRYSTSQSEEFNTASRSVKPGLIASGIVSCMSETYDWRDVSWLTQLLSMDMECNSLNELNVRILVRSMWADVVWSHGHPPDPLIRPHRHQDQSQSSWSTHFSRDSTRKTWQDCSHNVR